MPASAINANASYNDQTYRYEINVTNVSIDGVTDNGPYYFTAGEQITVTAKNPGSDLTHEFES